MGSLDKADNEVETKVDAIKSKTDNLPSDPASTTDVNTRLASADYTAPDNASASAAKTAAESANTKIGANTDAAGTTTLFARVRQIVDSYLADATNGLANLRSLIVGLTNKSWKALTPDAWSSTTLGQTEVVIAEWGAAGNTTDLYRLEGCALNLSALGTNTSYDFKLKSEINGTLQTIGTVTRSATGVLDLLKAASLQQIASRHIQVTVLGSGGTDATGSASATVVASKATP